MSAIKLTLALVVCSYSIYARAQAVHGVFRVVKGDVQVKSAKSGELTRARLGAQVYPQDMIITGKEARAKIVMVDNNEINVSPESQIEIQHYEYDPAAGHKDVLLNVIYGKVRSKVEQKYDGKQSKYQVKTPSAVAGVRGTDFIASYDRATSNSQVTTFTGRVEFGTLGRDGAINNAVFVTPGQQASKAAGAAAPSAPTALPKAELAKIENESRAESAAPSSSTGDKHQPAGDKKDKSGNNGSGANGNGNASNSSSSDNRAPASTGGSMLRPEDMAGSANAPTIPAIGPAIVPALLPPLPVTPVQGCDFCKDAVQNGPSKVQVNIHPK